MQWIALTQTDPFARGLEYLRSLQTLVPDPGLIHQWDSDLPSDRLQYHLPICTWIGSHIDTLNAQLDRHLTACQDCFYPDQRPAVQIFAAPLAPAYGIDGFCNLELRPIPILIDVGRVVRSDWLRLVVHEYAHAKVGTAGHDSRFLAILEHLCLGLAIPLPSDSTLRLQQASRLPDYRALADASRFWMGNH
ncbi:MAG: hypothetical protein MUF49_13505 [Oculatellaceae cyanobacterium Prado106]|nr:hypothetical protein [Oculatellaceae cyanobacterium Prado106]